MLPLIVLILSSFITDCLTKPTTESTHSILQRLGFDQVQRPVINHHKKRVAQETTKARHHIDGYNSETDSHMFVVKLPPHHPYYSHLKPQKFENEVISKSSMNFRTNGKPSGVYHWNIPVLKNLPQSRFGASRVAQGDSKVYHVKILPNEYPKDYKEKEKAFNKLSKFKKQRFEDGSGINKIKQSSYHNNLRLYSIKNSIAQKDQSIPLKKLPESHFKFAEPTHSPAVQKTKHNKNYMHDKMNESLVRDAANAKDKRQRGPSYYQPALPKQNSFHKDFTGNGKPKSFYVIEKSNKATRYHRLF
ncbi:UNVERIFIED_CONTAM: hypothetical protein PYX00_000206 [Menopon gallinae]|uniref:Uncharacterized protein n=1 Tax=Menopon gallinae TaxID=328185 RepID=A0AAW2I8A1_9NEOP